MVSTWVYVLPSGVVYQAVAIASIVATDASQDLASKLFMELYMHYGCCMAVRPHASADLVHSEQQHLE